MSLVTLTTDFGPGSHYVAAMKGAILSVNPLANIVDLTHGIRPQDVRHAAVVLEDVTDRFPADTLHVVVVDPGVGTDRALVYARIGRQHYLCPDNGLLSRLARRTPPAKVIKLDRPEFWLQPVSNTFHGRDILAPAAAHLSLGTIPERLGSPLKRLVDLDWPEVRLAPNRIEGSVILVDSFGNLITDITQKMLTGKVTDKRAHLVCGIRESWGIQRTYADMPPGSFIALIGSSSRLELAIVDGSAAARFNIKPGTKVTITWE